MTARNAPHPIIFARSGLILLLALFFAVQPAAAQSPDEVARIEALTGAATVVREAGTLPAAPGLHLLAGDSLETAAGARVELLFLDGTALVVGPEAEIKIEDYLLADDGSRQNGAVTLVDGVVRAVVAPGAAESFSIQGQAAVASVRGTELLVIEEEATTSVFVVEGHVVMAGPVGVWLVKLAAGEGADARLEPMAAALPTPPPTTGAVEAETSMADDTPADAPMGESGAGGTVIIAPAPMPSPSPSPAAPGTAQGALASRDAEAPAVPRSITNVVAGPRPDVAAWSEDRVGALLSLTTLP